MFRTTLPCLPPSSLSPSHLLDWGFVQSIAIQDTRWGGKSEFAYDPLLAQLRSTDTISVAPDGVDRQIMPFESPQLATMRRSPLNKAAIAVDPSLIPTKSVKRNLQVS